MEMLPPAPSVVVGAAVVKRFPGYGVHRGSIVEIDGNRVVVHWAATDERTTLTLKEAAKRVVASPLADEEDDDDQSVTSTALGIESSATSFTAPRHERGRRDGCAGAEAEAARPLHRGCSGPGARSDRDVVQILGRDLDQEGSTVDGAIH